MGKSSNKSKNKKPTKDAYTVTEVGTLIEQLRSEFRVFAEDLISVKADIKSLKEMVANNTERITFLEIAVRNMSAKIEALTESIDKLVKTKTDREELLALEKRISILESKITLLSQ